MLFWVEIAQAAIGFVQYFTHLPVALVAAHMLGAGLVWTGTIAVLLSIRSRPALSEPPTPSSPASLPATDPVPSR